eukprot:CAMPEP_0181248056 /NCGR_PEP_ID=MMETSP1096-20121128/44956_1 /TAXON_ID=156174 ORGANISM="Chrysochromulina ericina, Strain CCMP281" /NCGR_SAMPLE_ID=MMETSP1096 /ASSEMBLY_ACC=CAM_ASM_000453 /LENGTH=176 /DNA_ID=CAMNT_0023345179 /DNA_START=231 /DNA_END=758 /DNA_ORIENTATION=-
MQRASTNADVMAAADTTASTFERRPLPSRSDAPNNRSTYCERHTRDAPARMSSPAPTDRSPVTLCLSVLCLPSAPALGDRPAAAHPHQPSSGSTNLLTYLHESVPKPAKRRRSIGREHQEGEQDDHEEQDREDRVEGDAIRCSASMSLSSASFFASASAEGSTSTACRSATSGDIL